MRLTRKKIIELCIALWEWLAKTGKHKGDWPEWEKYGRDIVNYCWFCEYTARKNDGLICGCGGNKICPYYIKYGHCNRGSVPFSFWCAARSPRARKKYAKLFLEQIRKIKT